MKSAHATALALALALSPGSELGARRAPIQGAEAPVAGQGAATPDAQTSARLFALVAETHRALGAADYDRVRKGFDLGRLLDAALALLPHPRGKDPFWRWTWTSEFLAGLAQNSEALGTVPVLRALAWHAEHGRFALVTRQRDASGVDVYLEWWIEPRGAELWIVDYGNLDTGRMLSEYMASGISAALQELSYEAYEDALRRGQESARAGDLEEVQRILREELALWPASFTQPLEVSAVQAAILRAPAAALALLEQFDRRHPRAALTALLGAQALDALGRREEAARELELYEALIHGPDKATLFQRAIALRAEGRTREAVDTLGRALDDDPEDVTILGELASCLPRWEMEELRERFLAMADGAGAFEPLVASLLDAQHYDAVECLCRAQLEARPEDADGLYYLALLHLTLEQYDVALREAREALERAPAQELGAFQRLFLDACLGVGSALSGYDASPRRAEAFRYLAAAFRGQGDLASSRALCDRHAAFDAADPWLGLYRALLAVDGAEPQRGIELLWSQWRAAGSGELREALRWHLVDSAYTHQDALAVWREALPAEESFAQLVATAFEAGDGPFLARLAADHLEWSPLDPLQAFYEGLASLLGGEPERALRQLERVSAEVEEDGRFVFLHDQALVRAHLRNGDPQAAGRCARASQARDGDPFLPLLAAVGGGAREEAHELLRECLRSGYDPYFLYADPDVGALLRSDAAFEELHSEYPPPLTEDGRD